MFGKKYQITAKTKKNLEKELKELETKGRQDIAEKLDWLRQQPTNEEDNPFTDLLEDKSYLEKRISEIKEILSNCSVIKGNVKHKVVEIGSTVKVGFEGFEDEYLIVSSIEADPLKKRISDESPVGKSLMGAKVGDTVDVKIGAINKKFRILKVN
jgi:transcription elongation factor GreA